MDANEIIQLALTGMRLLANSIESANSGDLEGAKANLKSARDHYASAGIAWDDAAQPGDTGAAPVAG